MDLMSKMDVDPGQVGPRQGPGPRHGSRTSWNGHDQGPRAGKMVQARIWKFIKIVTSISNPKYIMFNAIYQQNYWLNQFNVLKWYFPPKKATLKYWKQIVPFPQVPHVNEPHYTFMPVIQSSLSCMRTQSCTIQGAQSTVNLSCTHSSYIPEGREEEGGGGRWREVEG